ncbi:uncharacterized protein C16orf46 homolog isoform X1 [Anarrhichthys ocellatus]|uniref:uncharacterized protein C16orf46 homolog isoform X1 n=1 Tax=Anarrhichthys ocellatus TaxID=433405 RepID=UPI0012ED45DE|nr:uncharacterized protein C16orf46 homolog isoform X1 [Anarrhichthys ocellatus]XP_031702363.1 uncharacterized protein C16orf46 homolog isoform X1 [Anarrhichthys ocellatus]
MATLKEVDHIVVNGSEEELPTQEEAVEEQTPERRHVDVLLDISEEDFMKELEPHEYNCYSGWEEAVHGWARVAPLSCTLSTQKRYNKTKHADNPRPLTVDPTILDANSSTSIAERRCESHVGLHNSFKKPIPLNQHTGSWGNTVVEALQKDGSEWSVLNPLQKTTSKLPLKEKIEKEGTLRDTCSQPHHLPSKYSNNGATKPQKQRYRPNNTVVPVKNITYLPPIISIPPIPQTVSGQLCSGRKAQEEETIEENCFVLDARSGTRGARVAILLTQSLPLQS